MVSIIRPSIYVKMPFVPQDVKYSDGIEVIKVHVGLLQGVPSPAKEAMRVAQEDVASKSEIQPMFGIAPRCAVT